MDACLIETAPTTKTAPATSARWIAVACIATIAVGVAWRSARYLAGFPIWGDEAMLLLNILERDYVGLTHHLRFAQVAPLLFLWLEKTALIAFGPSEWSVHLFPFLAGLAALFFFWRTCRAAFSPTVAGLAVAILAVSYYPVRHSAEVKPYAFDLLYAVVFAWLTLGQLRNPLSSRWLVGLALVAPIAVFSSYPSAFVGGAVSLVLLPYVCRASWTQRSLYVLFNLALCGSFLIHFLLVGQENVSGEEAQRIREFLQDYWKDAFPPDSLVDWPLWLVKVFTGNMLAYPIGAHKGGSTLTFLLIALGSFAIGRKAFLSSPSGRGAGGEGALLALCWLPFALNLVAAILHRYPFGESARVTLHLAPFIVILMAHGLAQALDWIGSPDWRARGHFSIYAFLLVCGVVGMSRDFVKPYKTEHDREVRRLVRDLRAKVADNEPVRLCHSRDEELIAEFTWYVRTQTWSADWLSAAPPSSADKSCWLILCANHEPSAADALSSLGASAPEWAIAETGVRAVPPENNKMPVMYCRWVRIVRP